MKEKKGNDTDKSVENTIIEKNKKINKHKYFGYTSRLVLYSVLSMLSVALCIFSFMKSISYTEQKSTKYSENSFLDYKVYLKPNDFYETNYLGKDMIYIASLIKNIQIDFNYNFFIEDFVNMNFSYDIIGKLVISDESGSNVFFQKEYVLKEAQAEKLENKTTYSLTDKILIDYDYYNSLANNFRITYGVDAVSNLNVYLRINKTISESSDVVRLSNQENMSITIPLTEKAININMNYKEINNSNYISNESELVMSNYLFIIISVILFVVAVVLLSKVFKLLSSLITKKSVYDKHISKILSEYDRLIVETTTNPRLDDFSIIKINKFEELLDVRDNLKLPIMHYTVTPHQKSYFYIKFNKDVYLFVVKAVDLEEK